MRGHHGDRRAAQTLVDILNRLFVAVVQRESNEIAIETLDALVDYTKTHFGLEEKLLLDVVESLVIISATHT